MSYLEYARVQVHDDDDDIYDEVTTNAIFANNFGTISRRASKSQRASFLCSAPHKAIHLAPHTVIDTMTIVIGLVLMMYFGCFSTLFVYLPWLLLGIPLHVIVTIFMPNSGHTYVIQRWSTILGLVTWVWLLGMYLQSVPLHMLGQSANHTLKNLDRTFENNETVFIAANLYNSASLFPQFADNLLQLVDLLGGEHQVYVSIFESCSEDDGRTSKLLVDLDRKLSKSSIQSRIVTGTTNSSLPAFSKHVGIDQDAFQRIEFLAQVRNEALRPLDDGISGINGKKFHRVVWLNE